MDDDSDCALDGLHSGGTPRGQLVKGRRSAGQTSGAADPNQESLARQYVVTKGAADQREYIYAYDLDTGNEIDRGGGKYIDRVELTGAIKAAAKQTDRRVALHHNHPNGSSVSAADLSHFIVYPGLARLVAHDHSGNSYTCVIVQRTNLYRVLNRVHFHVMDWVRDFEKSCAAVRNDTEWLISHLMCRALHEAGLLQYQFPVDAEDRQEYDFPLVGAQVLIMQTVLMVKQRLGLS